MDKDELINNVQIASLAAHFAVCAAGWAASDHKARFSGSFRCVRATRKYAEDAIRDLRLL